MSIRLANKQDSHAIFDLALAFRHQQQRQTPTEIELTHSIKKLLSAEDAEFHLCECDGKIVGYLLLRFRHALWAAGSEASLEDIYLHPDYRKRGHGKRLVQFAVQRAQDIGCSLINLAANESNQTSTRMYSAFGFNSFSERWNGHQLYFRLNLAE